MIEVKVLEDHLGPIRDRAVLVGGLGIVLLVVGAALDMRQFMQSYLVGVLLWTSVSIGALALMLIHNVTGGLWGHVTRRITESAARAFPLLLVLFIPVMLGTTHIYEWADAAKMAKDHHLQLKQAYLNVPFFIGRAVVFFLVWGGLGVVMSRLTRDAEQEGDTESADIAERYSGPGLALLVVTVTFAGIDWLMSLEPKWVSAAYGLIFGVSGLVAGHAFQLMLLPYIPGVDRSIGKTQLNDLGNFLLGFVMFWTYVTFSQFLIIWCGNIQEEVVYYLARIRGGWHWVAWVIAFTHFFIPFFLLLSPSNKRHLPTLTKIAWLVFFSVVVDLFWLVQPVFRTGFSLHWMDVVAPLAVGGVWLWLVIGHVIEDPLRVTPREGGEAHG